MEKKHIDDVQAPTVEEHFKLILEDDSAIDPESTDVTPDDFPDWYDENLYKQMQQCYRRNVMSISANNVMGLMLVLSIPDILKVLLFTKQHDTICSAYKRYLETLLHIHTFYTCDPNNLKSKWFKSMNVIRWKHRTTSKRSKKACIGVIQQRDMVLTQFGFVGFVLTAPKSLGLNNTPEEEEAFNHFWRVNGYMLGIPNRLNVCRKTVAETRALCQKIVNDVCMKNMTEVPPEFFQVVSNVLKGLWMVDMSLNADAFLAMTYRTLGLEYKKPLGWYSKINMKYQTFVLSLFHVSYIGPIVKAFYSITLTCTYWFAEKLPLVPWLIYGNNCRINLYPKYE